jgi:putative acyl-CoA dehydrogenase
MFEVQNQPPPLEPYNLFASDVVLHEAVKREGAGWAQGELSALGATFGKPETVQLGFDANKFPPQLRTLDRYGHRLDEVEFHPAWHELLGIALKAGLHSSPWAEPKPGAHVARAAGTYMLGQIESGVYCPVAMTYGSVPSLRHTPAIAAEWLPRIFSREYDRRFRPPRLKTATLIGMGMTENQGGSDLRMNTTRAEPSGDGAFRLFGHKWFLSAPMCDAFLVLAQSPKGLSCFLMPRWTPEGERNAMQILRLKDKLGNRSNASCEVEFAGAAGWLLGDEGRGVQVIIEMVQHTRLDCAIGSAGIVKSAAAQALHHAQHRRAFGHPLAEQPLMQNVLADLAIEAEAAAASALRLASTFEANADEAEAALSRLATPALKYWLCKRAPMVVAEAIEVLGGNAYVEESALPRLYREAPLNSIWEGSGNIMCLDVLRAARREPNAVAALLDELALASGGDARLDRHIARLGATFSDGALDEAGARRLAADVALALAAALLVRNAAPAVADAFCASRFGESYSGALGTLPSGVDCAGVLTQAGG